jgi:DnaJ-class molecular chaperone
MNEKSEIFLNEICSFITSIFEDVKKIHNYVTEHKYYNIPDHDGMINCPDCKGDGYIICDNCEGNGYTLVRKGIGVKNEIITCEKCNGIGDITCKTCSGSGKIASDKKEASEVKISDLTGDQIYIIENMIEDYLKNYTHNSLIGPIHLQVRRIYFDEVSNTIIIDLPYDENSLLEDVEFRSHLDRLFNYAVPRIIIPDKFYKKSE